MRVFKNIASNILVLFLALPALARPIGTPLGELWQDRGNVSALNLIEGPGAKNHRPGLIFKFIKESKEGTSPKFDIKDENGVKWKVKLGHEAKSETAATRLVWAAGYIVDEDYYLPKICVQDIKPLSRGQKYVTEDGCVQGARLERIDGRKKVSNWSWYKNPFVGTREFNGLRVMMALINNWDLKGTNNGLYSENGTEPVYAVADLGASFGRTGNYFTRTRGMVKDYANSKFIEKVTPEYVNFVMHSRPFFLTVFDVPNYQFRTHMESIAKRIPIEDARWLGERLGQLSPEQIRDCFRAAGFSPAEVEGYTRIVLQRIEELKELL